MDVNRIQELVLAKFGADARVAAVYLFGSRARGTARPDSDVDQKDRRREMGFALPPAV